MIVLCYLIIGFLTIIVFVTLFNAFTAPMLKNGPQPTSQLLVSILVPARNESKNIRDCLESLLMQNYPRFEIMVLDDQSSDNTAEIVQTIVQKDPRVTCINGKDLPNGWTGKNWACHQLSQRAKGDILIFTDADNRHAQTAVSKTVGWMQKLELDLFSAFPQQHTHTFSEKLVVPSVYMTVYCYLPLWLTYLLPFPSLAAANGQWLAFTKQAYQRLRGHETAKNQIVEDTWLARYAKTQNMKTITTAGTKEVFGRMYQSWSEIWQGFSKNLFGLMGYQFTPFIILLLFMIIEYVLPYVLIFYPPVFKYAAFAIVLNVIIRTTLAVKYKDPIINILLHPIAILVTVFIGINSIIIFKHTNLEWKGRKIFINQK